MNKISCSTKTIDDVSDDDSVSGGIRYMAAQTEEDFCSESRETSRLRTDETRRHMFSTPKRKVVETPGCFMERNHEFTEDGEPGFVVCLRAKYS